MFMRTGLNVIKYIAIGTLYQMHLYMHANIIPAAASSRGRQYILCSKIKYSWIAAMIARFRTRPLLLTLTMS